MRSPRCIIIAGPNGAGKTTFAREFLPKDAGVVESTLSGLTYLSRLKRWKSAGYRIEIIFLRLASVALARRRIAVRVKQGGHDVPHADVLRRFARGWKNFEAAYKPLADVWAVYDNSGVRPQLLETKR
jgi:predicted ABC-type ATPase